MNIMDLAKKYMYIKLCLNKFQNFNIAKFSAWLLKHSALLISRLW